MKLRLLFIFLFFGLLLLFISHMTEVSSSNLSTLLLVLVIGAFCLGVGVTWVALKIEFSPIKTKAVGHYRIYKLPNGKWQFQRVSNNYRAICTSQEYEHRQQAFTGMDADKKLSPQHFIEASGPLSP